MFQGSLFKFQLQLLNISDYKKNATQYRHLHNSFDLILFFSLAYLFWSGGDHFKVVRLPTYISNFTLLSFHNIPFLKDLHTDVTRAPEIEKRQVPANNDRSRPRSNIKQIEQPNWKCHVGICPFSSEKCT